MKSILTADWIAPMSRPLIMGGAVVIGDGRIIAVGDRATLRRDYADAVVEDLGRTILLPGLINPHVHLELSDAEAGTPPESFGDWLKRRVAQTVAETSRMTDVVTQAVRIGVEQCLKFGVTCVGDISRRHAISRPLLSAGPLRAISFGEVTAMAQRRASLEERLSAAIDTSSASPRLRLGITPHAPYSVEPAGYRRCLEAARLHNMPLATHLAETPDEATFLADHTGPFRDLWQWLDAWDEHVPTFSGGPIRLAESLGVFAFPTLLAHVNYCDDAELDILSHGRASVVYCPRTHRYFNHPPHRWRDMLDAGINVAVGTDSCASSPDLNIVDDLRLLRQIAPDLPAAHLWELITTRAADALGETAARGSITTGKSADFVAFPATSSDPLQPLLENSVFPAAVWIEGRRT